MSPAPSRLLRVLAILTVLALASTGCSGEADDADAADSSGSTGSGDTASASPSPTTSEDPDTDDTDGTDGTDESGTAEETEPEPPERPRDKPTAGSRTKYAEFVMASWTYALSANDPAALSDLWLPKKGTCGGCAALTKELKQRRKEGWHVELDDLEVRKVTVKPANKPRTFLATAKVDIPATLSYFDDGTFRNESEAHEGATFQVRMTWPEGKTAKKWSLVAFRVS